MDKKEWIDLQIKKPYFNEQHWNIKEYGAVGDGLALNTEIINNVIEKCHIAGGGYVIIPRGLWLTGPIYMKSNVNLHLEEGATLIFSRNIEDYPLIMSNYEGLENIRCTSPIMGTDLDNIAITGKGIIDGCGDAWRPVKKFKLPTKHWQKLINSGGGIYEGTSEDQVIWFPHESSLKGFQYYRENEGQCLDMEVAKASPAFFRPVLLSFTNCKQVVLDGPTFQNSPAWCLHIRLCEHVTVQNINVRNPWFSSNGDGIDLESCRYVYIGHSTFDVGDDAICFKSGKNEEGRALGMPTQDVIVEDCTVYHGHGGFVIGSEMSGGIKNIKLARCTFIGTDVGLRFKSCRGRGGVVENIHIEDVTMKDIAGEAIIFSTAYNLQVKNAEECTMEDIPEFCHIYMKDVVCNGARVGIALCGLPEKAVHHIEFKNMKLKVEKGISCAYCHDIYFKNIEVISEKDPSESYHSGKMTEIHTDFHTLF